MLDSMGFPFPFGVDGLGRVSLTEEDEALRAKIIQVLFTAPGERVHEPQFGCGLFDMLFEPNNEVMAAAAEFTIGQALNRWLADELVAEAVAVSSEEETALVIISYTRKSDLTRQAVRIRFR